MDVATPFPRHFHVLFDVALCLPKLSNDDDDDELAILRPGQTRMRVAES